MKALIQRVSRARVSVAGAMRGEIGPGLLVLLGIRKGDLAAEAEELARRTAVLRIFSDGQGKMNRSLADVSGQALVISQFTLYADTRRGNRPGFSDAAPPDEARPLYERYIKELQRLLAPQTVATGVFQAAMQVELVNDGPVTLELRSRSELPPP